MRKQDSWSSQFRKKRFYERQELKRERQYWEDCKRNESYLFTKTIAVLLDLDGTCDYINDEKAMLFVKQLDTIRKKIGAEYGTISISTHYRDPSKMKAVLDILSRNLSTTIKIGTNFFYGGTYNYDENEISFEEHNFNSSKMDTFETYYLESLCISNRWFAVIDDGIHEDTYKKYQNNHAMLLCRPSKSERDVAKNCFMSIATTTKGFDGVIEVLDEYIQSIKFKTPEMILETQRKMITHLSSHELVTKIRNREYEFIERYFREGYADDTDYVDALTWLQYTYNEQTPTKEELVHLKNILWLLTEQFKIKNDGQKLEKANALQVTISNV